MPAVTRRRTGKLPPPRNPVGSTDNGDEVEEDLNKPEGSNVRKRARGTTKVEASKDGGDFEDDSDGEGEQDDEEDYTGSGKRSAKRRKVEPSSKGKATRKRKDTAVNSPTNGTKTKLRGNRGKLQNMLSMPLDIFYEVCMLLSPADLLSLARTSKGLRATMMSRSSISVWKAARRSLYQPDLPWDLPIEFSEPEWAALALVRACTECNTKNAHSVEWCFKRRLCMACKKSNYVFEGRFKKEYPGTDPAVLELLPYTHIGISARGYPSNKRYFWRSDLENMVEYREKLLKDVSMRRVGATAALTELDTEEAEATSLFMEGCEDLDQWYSDFETYRTDQSYEAKNARFEAIKTRLLALGYGKEDINSYGFLELSVVDSIKPLTDRGWKQIKPKLEEYCQKRRDERLKAERLNTRHIRIKKTKCLYAEYRSHILPSEWSYLPSPEQAYRLPWCAEIIEQDLKTQLLDADFDLPLTNLPSSVEAWAREKRDAHIALLPEEYRGALSPTASMIPTTLTSSSVNDVRQGRSPGELRPFLGPLELAMAVFQGYEALVARDMCNAWKGTVPLEFSSLGSGAVLQMLELAELDPKTTTAVDFDAVDHRFFCLSCCGTGDTKAETWRSAVEHQLGAPKSTHATPAWKLIPPAEAIGIKEREGSVANAPYANECKWHCQHCVLRKPMFYRHLLGELNIQEYIDISWNRQSAVEHVRSEHGIPDPSQNDVVYMPYCGTVEPGIPTVSYIPEPDAAAEA